MAFRNIQMRLGISGEMAIHSLFRPATEGAKKARETISAEGKAAGNAFEGEMKKAATGAAKAMQSAIPRDVFGNQVKEAKKSAAEIVSVYRTAGSQIQKTFSQVAPRNKDGTFALNIHEFNARRVREVREYMEAERAAARQSAQIAAEEAARNRKLAGDRFRGNVMRVGGEALQTTAAMGRRALGIAKEIAGGAGINFDIGSHVGASVSMEEQAVALSNAAFRGKKGEQRIDAAGLVKQSRQIGDDLRLDPTKVIGGLARFQETTGQLEVGMAGLKEWSAFAKATGTELDVLIASAGEVSVALGNAFATPEAKAKAITNVLKTLGAQGQEGAVEFRSLATQMPKLSAAAAGFEGDKAENLKKMGALVQLAKQQGGAPSATAAATSIAGFANTLKTPARVKQFEDAGVKVFSDKEKGKIRDPFEILNEALDKKGMDPIGFKKMFANIVGAKPAEALAATYRDAGGGAEGKKAVAELLDKFMGSMSDEKLAGDLQAAMGTQASKIQMVNNQLAKLGETIAGQILPKLTEAGPGLIKFAGMMTNVAAIAIDNPGLAITAAIVASIAKAGISMAISEAFKRALENIGGVGAGGAPVPGVGGAQGAAAGKAGNMPSANAMASSVIIGLGLGVAAVGAKMPGKAREREQEGMTEQMLAASREKLSSEGGVMSAEEVDALAERYAQIQRQLKEAEESGGYTGVIGGFKGLISAGMNKVGLGGKSFEEQGEIDAVNNRRGVLEAQSRDLQAAIERGFKSNASLKLDPNGPAIRVIVDNAKDIGAGGAGGTTSKVP